MSPTTAGSTVLGREQRAPLIGGPTAATPAAEGPAPQHLWVRQARARQEPVWILQAAQALDVPTAQLHRFVRLMAQAGHPVDLTRFYCDLTYAFRQLALAHSCACAEAQAGALALFEPCQRLADRREALARSLRTH
jgi:hypothetical protein